MLDELDEAEKRLKTRTHRTESTRDVHILVRDDVLCLRVARRKGARARREREREGLEVGSGAKGGKGHTGVSGCWEERRKWMCEDEEEEVERMMAFDL